ncbi:MAG: hypothetical protein QXX38_02310 [Candidatus Aenigmatarchaeota archaeon]
MLAFIKEEDRLKPIAKRILEEIDSTGLKEMLLLLQYRKLLNVKSNA